MGTTLLWPLPFPHALLPIKYSREDDYVWEPVPPGPRLPGYLPGGPNHSYFACVLYSAYIIIFIGSFEMGVHNKLRNKSREKCHLLPVVNRC